MGGPTGPSVSRSPGVSPQKKAGRPMGPSTPQCPSSKCQFLCAAVWVAQMFLFGSHVKGYLFGDLLVSYFSPSNLGPC